MAERCWATSSSSSRSRTAGDVGPRASATSRAGSSALEEALLAGEIDLAVHSAKDVPGELAPTAWRSLAAPPRADAARRAGRRGVARRAAARARAWARASLRRRAQLLAARPDLEVVELRGNVDTRLRKLADGEVDALVLAAAGLERLGRGGRRRARCGCSCPRPGQGVLAVQARADDGGGRGQAADHRRDPAALDAERARSRALGRHLPHAGRRARRERRRALRGFAGLPDGSAWMRRRGGRRSGDGAGASGMLAAGAGELLRARRRSRERDRLPRRRRPGRPRLLTVRARELIARGRRGPLRPPDPAGRARRRAPAPS